MNRSSIWAVTAGLIVGLTCLWPAGRAEAQARAVPGVEITPIELTQGGTAHSVIVPQHKARIIRLPADARDVLIANPAIADIVVKTPRIAYVVGRETGVTNAFFFDGEGVEIARLEVRVEIDVLAVQEAIRDLIPNSDIKVKSVRNDLFLTGTVRSNDLAQNAREIAQRFTAGADRVFNMLSIIEDQQVLLQVRVAEMSRNARKNLGVDLAGTVTIGDVAGAFATGGLFTGVVPTVFGSGAINYTSGGDSFTAALNALERNGLIKTLAEPNLTAISGETANFLAGGEFPIPVAQGDGAIAVTFRQFGVGLNFTPVVLNSGRISLRLSTEVSALDFSFLATTGFPGLSTRRAETTVELPSGGSLMIAGLLQDDLGTSIEGLPYLKDLPILGPFFRDNLIDRNERELVVTITAYLVRPADKSKIVLPTTNVAPPTDYELFFLGRLEAVYGTDEDGGPTTTASLKGPIGYILK